MNELERNLFEARLAGWADCFELLNLLMREEALSPFYARVPEFQAFMLGFTDNMAKGKEDTLNKYAKILSENMQRNAHVQ